MRTPAGLSPAAKTAFREAEAALVANGRDPEAVVGAIVRFARSVERLEHVRARWRDAGMPVLTAGSRGQPALEPLLPELRALETHVAQLAERLGIALAPPRSSGWRRGHARAPDRAPRTNVRALKADFDRWVSEGGDG